MFAKTLGVLACAVLMTALAQPGSAQEKHKAGKNVTVTGCLAQGTEANQYNIKGEDGTTYALQSSSIDLKEHMGHKVTVTGSPVKQSKAEAKTGTMPGNEELRVTHLKMVSTSCQ